MIQELGSHWSMIIGDDCFEVIDDNMAEVSRSIDAVSLVDYETTESKTDPIYINIIFYYRFRKGYMRQ